MIIIDGYLDHITVIMQVHIVTHSKSRYNMYMQLHVRAVEKVKLTDTLLG